MSIPKKYNTYILLGAVLIVGLAVGMLFGNQVVEAASTHGAIDKKILIIYTGGTIGMVNTPDGLKNEPGKGTQQLDKYLSLYRSIGIKLENTRLFLTILYWIVLTWIWRLEQDS